MIKRVLWTLGVVLIGFAVASSLMFFIHNSPQNSTGEAQGVSRYQGKNNFGISIDWLNGQYTVADIHGEPGKEIQLDYKVIFANGPLTIEITNGTNVLLSERVQENFENKFNWVPNDYETYQVVLLGKETKLNVKFNYSDDQIDIY